MTTAVGPETTVTLFFEIRLENGDVVDSNFNAKPATFTVGDGNMLVGFEAAMFGLTVGERKVLTIAPEQGFGMPNPSNIHKIDRSQFDGMDLEPGLVVSFQDPTGELPGVVRSFNDRSVEVDFNHPLSGQSLQFEVEIIDVTQA
jgi:FKBP-type peptidyl-prolyl cis-trans isomerase SlpA